MSVSAFKIEIKPLFSILLIFSFFLLNAQSQRITEDFNYGWKFSLGHDNDINLDFGHGTGHFTYYAKTGYGDGAAAEKFDDRAWRNIQLPHDWCVTLPFSQKASNSHGSKALGKYFDDTNIGWYRKRFEIPQSDTSKRIRIEFDGVYRNSKVWVNGFFLGTQESGYTGFGYDITEYLNFGGSNVVSVRVDAGVEEGWFYEGAGIYRNVRLVKTSKIHVAPNGVFVSAKHDEKEARITIRTTISNDYNIEKDCRIESEILDNTGAKVTGTTKNICSVAGLQEKEFFSFNSISNPKIWSLESPVLYTLKTSVYENEVLVDTYETKFGVRNINFTSNGGFFLNGKSVKIKGVCVHQDHAGVGVAIPYELQKWRIQELKKYGINAIRTSHNPPTPELLDICDELGMLVMDEVRLMGINEFHQINVRELIKCDRNHPSVFIWSLGNEEWAIEGNIKGARIIENMQNYAIRFDSTRFHTVAISGGWETGIGMKVQIMGFNYLKHGNVDEHHKNFPNQPCIGTEESNTIRTRGIYTTDDSKCWMAPRNLYDNGMEGGWKVYYEKDYLSGLFYWTGFDYRGEPTPYDWPAVVSQFGILDLCGFPKDNAYYLKSWWTEDHKPVVHIEGNWNRTKGEKIDLTVYSNCKFVELFLNGKSIDKREMPFNGHITFPVTFEPGTLTAKGYGSWFTPDLPTDKVVCEQTIKTTGAATAISMEAHKLSLVADGQDVSIITVSIKDKNKQIIPNANVLVNFEIEGEGKIIGLGNGDPSSHEKDQFPDNIIVEKIFGMKELPVSSLENRPETAAGFDISSWRNAYSAESPDWKVYEDTLLVMKGLFNVSSLKDDVLVSLFAKSILENQSIYVNGILLRKDIVKDAPDQSFVLDHKILKPGENEICFVGKKFKKSYQWDVPNRDPGLIQVIIPAETPQRNTFMGYAQVIVQATKKAGTIKLKATAQGLQQSEVIIYSR